MHESSYRSHQKKQIRDYFDKEALNWDSPRRWNSYYKRKLAEQCRRLIPQGGSVLEVGCATGDLLSNIGDHSCVGIDIAPQMVQAAKKKYPQFTFEQGDIDSFSPKKNFNVIIMSDLVGSLTDLWQTFFNLKSMCQPQTRLIITYHNHLWEPIARLAALLGIKTKQPVQNWLTPAELREVLELHGFEIIRKFNFILLPVYIPLVSNFINKYVVHLPLVNRLCFSRCFVARLPESPSNRSDISTSIVVPCLNEAGNIAGLVERLPKIGSKMEILFMDGGSTDGTLEEIKKQIDNCPSDRTIRLMHQGPVKGKGSAVREAFAKASGDMLIILDADLSVPPEDIPKFYKALIEGRGELINGCRLLYSMEDGAMRFFNFLGNHFFRISFSWLLGQTIRDTLCGTKALLKTDYEKLATSRAYFGDFDPFGDFDLLFGAAYLNLRISNLPVRYEARRYGDTKIDRWGHGWLLLKMNWYALWKLKFI